MTRRTYIYDPETDRMVPKTAHDRPRVHMVRGELSQPFVSPVDGSYVSNYREWGEHNRRNGVVDVGNDSSVMDPKPKVYAPSEADIVDDIKRSIHEAPGNHDWKF